MLSKKKMRKFNFYQKYYEIVDFRANSSVYRERIKRKLIAAYFHLCSNYNSLIISEDRYSLIFISLYWIYSLWYDLYAQGYRNILLYFLIYEYINNFQSTISSGSIMKYKLIIYFFVFFPINKLKNMISSPNWVPTRNK